MDQIEKPLSILLIVAAIAYAFMYTDAGVGFKAIENNTASGYTIEAAELSGTGYNVQSADLSNKGYELNPEILYSESIIPNYEWIDSLQMFQEGIPDTFQVFAPIFFVAEAYKELNQEFEKDLDTLQLDFDSTIINDTEVETIVDSTNTEF